MALRIMAEGYRSPGFTPSGDLLAGQVVKMGSSESEIIVSTGTADELIGVALESTLPFPDPSRYYDLINKGGLVGTMHLGIVEVYDDSRGALFDGTSFALNKPVYWDGTNKLYTATAGSWKRVGVCMGVPSGSTGVLRLKLEI